MKNTLFTLVLLVLTGCSSQAHLAKQTWHEVQSPHFRVVTDGNVADVEALVQDLEKFRLALAKLLNKPHEDMGKLTVYALKNRLTYRGMVGGELAGNTMGVFYDRLYGHYALINLNGYQRLRLREGSWARQFLFHEYTHFVMARGESVHYPYWYREGVAEFFGTMDFDGEGGCEFGKIPVDRALTLNAESLIDLETLLRATQENIADSKRPLIYAGGWLLVHMLYLDPNHQEGLPAYIMAISTGEDPVEAYERIFGVSLDALEHQFKAYSKGGIASYATQYHPTEPQITTSTFAMDSAKAMAELGQFLVLTRPGTKDVYALRDHAVEQGTDVSDMNYSLAFQQMNDADSPLDESLLANFDGVATEELWPRLVYADYLRWQVEHNAELRKTHLTRAYNLYKSIIEQDDTIPAVWYGLGQAATHLMVPARVYRNYFWKAHDLSPLNEQAALAYLHALYESQDWPLFAKETRRVLPVIRGEQQRRGLLKMLTAIDKIPHGTSAGDQRAAKTLEQG